MLTIELTQSRSTFKRLLGLTVAILLLLFACYRLLSHGNNTVDMAALDFNRVQQGPIDIEIDSIGELISAQERLLTAPAMGKVAEILVRPGAMVTENTVIVRLENPQLVQQVTQAQGYVAQGQAMLAAYRYEQQNSLLNYQGTIEQLKAKLEMAQLELSVNKKLALLNIASKIKLQRAKLTAKQSASELSFEQKKYRKFIEMQRYQLTQKQIDVEQLQIKFNLLQNRLSSMSITAGLNGTLQTLAVELGQSVNQGESIAKIGSADKLVAKLRLPQRQADQISLGAKVIVDTRKGKIVGHISRIETLVTNGAVLAEAILDGPLTSNARPALTISAKIFMEHKTNALYVKSSPSLRANSKLSVFVRTADNRVTKQDVMFGPLTNQQLIIEHGLAVNDQIVANSMSDYMQFSTLELVE